MDRETVIALGAIEDNKILLVSKNEVLILPGGKNEGRETHLETLLRECGEELPRVQIDEEKARLWGSFDETTPHRQAPIIIFVYLAGVTGDTSVSGREVGGSPPLWWEYHPSDTRLSSATRRIVEKMVEVGLLKTDP